VRNEQTTDLDTLLPSGLLDSSSRPLIVLKLKDFGVIEGKILIWVPRRCSETLQTSVSLESGLCQSVFGGIDFIWEMQVIRVLLSAFLPECCKSASFVMRSVVLLSRDHHSVLTVAPPLHRRALHPLLASRPTRSPPSPLAPPRHP
jgi:hypothetical protein